MAELFQMFFKGLAPHENVIHINEVSANGGITHCFVEEDVEFCWGVGIPEWAAVPSVLAVAKGEGQFILVSWVDSHGPETIRNVHGGKEAGSFHLCQFLV